MSNFSKNLLLGTLSLVISLIAFEIIARKFLSVGDNWPNSSVWTQERWIENHESGPLGTTNFKIDRYDSLYGWTLQENLRNAVEWGNYIVNSNAQGARGKTEYGLNRNGKLRVLTIGDSFTFGECVGDSQSYPAILETLLDTAEVINLAVHGYGHDQQLLRLQHQGLKFQPDIVVLGFVNDDVNRNMLSFRDYAKPYFDVVGDSLQLKNVPVPKPEYYLKGTRIKSIALLKAKWAELTASNNDPANIVRTKMILNKIAATCSGVNVPLLVVYLPWDSECINNKAFPHELFDTLGTRQGVTLVNPVSAIHNLIKNEQHPETNFECHYSPAVNRAIAEELAKAVKKEAAILQSTPKAN